MRRLVAGFVAHRYLSFRLRNIRQICVDAEAYGTMKQHVPMFA